MHYRVGNMHLLYRRFFLGSIEQGMCEGIVYHAFLFISLFIVFMGAVREIEVRTYYWVLDKIYIFIYGM